MPWDCTMYNKCEHSKALITIQSSSTGASTACSLKLTQTSLCFGLIYYTTTSHTVHAQSPLEQ